jgi:chemotaxis protein CheZ
MNAAAGPAPAAPDQTDSLYAGIARLSRSLHENLRELGLDGRLNHLAGNDMPDARLRLDHVVQMTEEAAHRTLDLVDDGRAVADGLADVRAHLTRLHAQSFVHGLLEAGMAVQDAEGRLRGTLTALAQAQEYQDLSGQMIRRVIELLRQVEGALVELLGGMEAVQSAPPLPINPAQAELPGPALPGSGAADQGDADHLLASLGL